MTRDIHILVIEHDSVISNLLSASFGDRNCSVSVFSSVENLLAEVHETAQYAIIVADLDTAADDSAAISLINKIKQTSVTHTLPVVAIGTRRDVSHVIGVLNAGADDCIAKPLAPREFAARIAAILRRRG